MTTAVVSAVRAFLVTFAVNFTGQHLAGHRWSIGCTVAGAMFGVAMGVKA